MNKRPKYVLARGLFRGKQERTTPASIWRVVEDTCTEHTNVFHPENLP